MMLETHRLKIVPLTLEQLWLYLQPGHALETSMGLNEGCRTISEIVSETLGQAIIPRMTSQPEAHLFLTFWTIISKEDKVLVGDICFKGLPNDDGEVEIGYGTYEPVQRKGFMTEAVGAISSWALGQENIQAVLAETDEKNIASQRVLEKNGFRKYKTMKSAIFWRREAGQQIFSS